MSHRSNNREDTEPSDLARDSDIAEARPSSAATGGVDPRTKPRGRVPLSRKLLFSLAPLAVILALAECLFRVFPVHEDKGGTLSGFVVRDKELGWRLKPMQGGPMGSNALGFRDTPLNRNAEKRVLLLGDSVSWGDGVADLRHVYPYALERSLSERSGRTYEVMNASVPGYSTFQQLRYLQLHGMEFDPDMIVLQFCLNDVVERFAKLAEYGGDNVFLGIDTRRMIPGIHGWMIRTSRAYEALVRGLMGLARNHQEYDVSRMASDRLSPELESAWELTLTELRGIRDIARESGTPFLLVIAPYRFQLGKGDGANQPQRRLLAFCRENDIAVVDLLPHFEAARVKNRDLPLFNDANHFSIFGHAVVARVLSKPVLEMVEGVSPGEDRQRGAGRRR